VVTNINFHASPPRIDLNTLTPSLLWPLHLWWTGEWRANQHLNTALNGLGTGLNGGLNTWPCWAVSPCRSRLERVLRSVLRREGGVLRPPLRPGSVLSSRPARLARADFGRTVKVLRLFWRGGGRFFV
jgi:hypothetical protein